MKNILHISTESAWRGGENQLLLLLTHSRNLGFVHHVVVQPGSILVNRFQDVAVVHQVPMRNDVDLIASAMIAKIVSQESIEIIHAQSARGHSLGLFTKKILALLSPARVPRLIVHRRVEQKPKLTFLDRWKYLHAGVDLYICVSNAVAKGLISAGINTNKIRTVYSAADPLPHDGHEVQGKLVRTELAISPDAFVVCYVGSLEHAKGIMYLVDAWRMLTNQSVLNPDDRLLIIGTGPLLESLKTEFDEQGRSNISMTGFRSDVPRLLAASDVLVLPTLWEGLGTVLLDGLLAGCAPIASRVGGVPEIVIDGKTGSLVPPANAEALKDAIASLYANKDLRLRLARTGRQHVCEHFSIKSMVDGIIGCYLQIK